MTKVYSFLTTVSTSGGSRLKSSVCMRVAQKGLGVSEAMQRMNGTPVEI